MPELHVVTTRATRRPCPSHTSARRAPLSALYNRGAPIAIQSQRIFGTVRFATDGIEIDPRLFSTGRHPACRWTAPFAGSYNLLYGIYLKTGVGFRASTDADRRETSAQHPLRCAMNTFPVLLGALCVYAI